jgi:RNA polymerase sigma-70 factor (ECF subfamily)
VLAAQHRSSPAGRVAFAKLCEKYWYPLYAYVRQLEGDVHRARDLTQGFFEKVIEKNYIADADPSRGRFRTFLLASLTHFIANDWNKSQAIKRGGDRVHMSLDFDDGERRYARELTDEQTPEKQYERRWALTLLKQVLDRLQAEYLASGKEQTFAELQQYLTPGDTERHAAVGERLGMSESAVKVAVHRLRMLYRERLRLEIAETISDKSDVEDEIRGLFETFAM